MFGQPQQPMVISVNSPRMTKDEIKKSFLMKVAATTISFVAGLSIIGFIALKILPQRIAVELKGQTHSSMLQALDDQSIGTTLKRIKDRVLATECRVSDDLHNKWGNKTVQDIYRVNKVHDNFLRDIGQHLSVTDLGSLLWQQMFRKTFTQEFIKDQSQNFSDALLSDAAKQSLLQEVANNAGIQKILKANNATVENFSKLGKAQKDIIMAEVYQHAQASQSLSAAATEALSKAVNSSLLTEQNLKDAIANCPSLQPHADTLKALPDADKLNCARKLITMQDTIGLLAKSTSKSALPWFLRGGN